MLLTSLMRVILTRSFKPFLFQSDYQNKLDFEDLTSLGLYVHIPFCRSLCSFCPYCKEIYHSGKADAYKGSLLQEIDLVCKDMSAKKEVTSLYFGGGTPALMINDLLEIIVALKKYFVILGGIGVELHPEDITEKNLQTLRDAGVNMVSIGIQSFNEQCLAKLGRHLDSFPEKMMMVQAAGFETVDVDLIFALPGQTDHILAKDIKTAFEYGATQVSTYPFIDFTFADNMVAPVSDKEKMKMMKVLAETCRQNNLKRTSVWTFAKQGTQKYSSVTRDAFLGFGVSATSLLRDTFKINTFSIPEYTRRVKAWSLPTSLTLHFTKRQRAVYDLFWQAYGLRIDPAAFKKTVGVSLRHMFGLELFLAVITGFLRKHADGYELTEKAANLYHRIEQVYTTAYIDKMWHVSRTQAFPHKMVLR